MGGGTKGGYHLIVCFFVGFFLDFCFLFLFFSYIFVFCCLTLSVPLFRQLEHDGSCVCFFAFSFFLFLWSLCK